MKLSIVCLVALVAAPFARGQIPPEFAERKLTELDPGVYSYGNFAARSLVVITDAGVIVTDPTNSRHAAGMRDAVAALTDQPVRYVVYSHQHWDHALGGRIFAEAGAEFWSHEKCLPHWNRHPHPELVLPDVTVPGNADLKLGGRTLRLTYHGINHGDCVLVMQLDHSDVLYVNDLVTPFSVGLGFMPDYDPVEWIRTLRELEERPGWNRMMGAHGIPVAPKSALTQRRRYLEALMAEVRAKMDAGLRREALYEAVELPEEFRSLRGSKTELKRAAERIYHYYTMGW